MSYPWTTAQIAAVGRLGEYNGSAYNPTTNPKGMANGGHRINFTPSLNDASTVAGAIKEAADFTKERADAAKLSEEAAAAYAARMSGTSTTAVTLGSGSKTFTTQAGKFFDVGRTLRVVSGANPNVNFMIGKVTAYSGTALTISVQLFNGSGSPSDWQIYVDGELGPSGTLAITGAASLAPDQLPTAVNTGTATAAQIQLGIPRGMPAGLYYKWSANTLSSDPTGGRVKASSATLTNAQFLYVSEADANGVAYSAVLQSWDDSTNPVRGTVRIEDLANPANWVAFNVTGAITDNGPWDTIPVAYVDKGGTLVDGVSVRIEYVRAGNRGSDGADGAPGAAATIAVGGVSKLTPGALPTVTNTGTANAAQLTFGIPQGVQGVPGPVIATRFNFDTAIADADPGDGNVRFNSATLSSVTQIFLDNVEATGGTSVAAYIDSFDDSSNPSVKGTLLFKDVNDQSKFAIFNITGVVATGTGGGYRKVTVVYQSGNGGFTAGAQLGMSFDRAGDKGADGGGAGNVVGPATSTVGNFVIWNNSSGTATANGGTPGALATKSSINNNDWSGAALSIGNGGTGAATVGAAQTNLNLVPGTHVQAYSGKLAALDALTWAANKGVYFTSASAVATYDLSSFGRTLSGAADAAAAQASLQLRPGQEVQAYDVELQALAGLTSAADRLPYFTGSGTAALTVFTSVARSLLDDTSTAAMLATLGALPTAGGTMTGDIVLKGDPTQDLHPVTRRFVQGRPAKDSFRAGTTAALTVTATATTLTNSGTNAALVLDTVTLAVGDRVLVKNQADQAQNGLFSVTVAGSSTVPWVLTRVPGGDQWADLVSAICIIDEGTQAEQAYVCSVNGTTGTIGTTAITFEPFGGRTKANADSPVFTGEATFAASTTATASFMAPHGVAPTAPVNGDFWTTTGGAFIRINGTSQQLSAINVAETYTAKKTTLASATGGAGFNLPAGAAPTSPVAGDVWTTTGGLFVRVGSTSLQASFLNQAGTYTAKQTFTAATASSAFLNIAHGAAPTSPANGDLWSTTAGLFFRANGVTQQLNAATAAAVADVQAGTDTAKYVTPNALSASAAFQTLADAATIAWPMATGYNATVTLSGNRVLGVPTGATQGLVYALVVKQDATGSRTLSYSSAFDLGAAGAPTLSTAANKTDVLSFLCLDAVTPTFRFLGINKG